MISPRVLIAGNFLSAHGRSRGVCEELAPKLQERGWSVITTSSRPWRPVRLADMLSTTWRYRHDYDVAQVDVFSGTAFLWAEAVCWALRRVDRPYVLTLHGGNLPEFACHADRRVRNLLNSAAAVTAPSRYLLSKMKQYRADMMLLPNALNVPAYEHPVRETLQPRLIWVRAFHDIYNPAMALRVLALLKDEFPSISLTMAGPDKGLGGDKIISLARAYGVEANLKVQGQLPKEQVPESLGTADIFLNTSSVDNTPVSVLEAMAAGLCVVSTNAGGIPYLLESDQEALLVPINDDIAMAGAVRRLLTNQALAEHIQKNSLAKARTFDWTVVLPQWQQLLTAAAGKTLAPMGVMSPSGSTNTIS